MIDGAIIAGLTALLTATSGLIIFFFNHRQRKAETALTIAEKNKTETETALMLNCIGSNISKLETFTQQISQRIIRLENAYNMENLQTLIETNQEFVDDKIREISLKADITKTTLDGMIERINILQGKICGAVEDVRTVKTEIVQVREEILIERKERLKNGV